MKAKDYIIAELERADGAYLSGEELAEKLNISRQAVWKAIKSLQADGYDIDGATNRGYALNPDCDKLSSAILRNLTAMRVYVFDEVGSTNDEAKRIFATSGECAVTAARQTDGRKKDGTPFASPKDKGVYLTCAFTLDCAADRRREFAEVCAEAICAIVSDISSKKAERADNRIYIDGRQACGILTEGQINLDTDRLTAVFIGVGVYTAQAGEELGFADCDERRNQLIAKICLALRGVACSFRH